MPWKQTQNRALLHKYLMSNYSLIKEMYYTQQGHQWENFSMVRKTSINGSRSRQLKQPYHWVVPPLPPLHSVLQIKVRPRSYWCIFYKWPSEDLSYQYTLCWKLQYPEVRQFCGLSPIMYFFLVLQNPNPLITMFFDSDM